MKGKCSHPCSTPGELYLSCNFIRFALGRALQHVLDRRNHRPQKASLPNLPNRATLAAELCVTRLNVRPRFGAHHSGVSCFRDPPRTQKMWFSFWLPVKTTKSRVPQSKSTPFRLGKHFGRQSCLGFQSSFIVYGSFSAGAGFIFHGFQKLPAVGSSNFRVLLPIFKLLGPVTGLVRFSFGTSWRFPFGRSTREFCMSALFEGGT